MIECILRRAKLQSAGCGLHLSVPGHGQDEVGLLGLLKCMSHLGSGCALHFGSCKFFQLFWVSCGRLLHQQLDHLEAKLLGIRL